MLRSIFSSLGLVLFLHRSVGLVSFVVFWIWLVLAQVAAAQEPRKILFVGNSYILHHSVDVQVAQLSSTARPSVEYETTRIARNGATLDEQLEQALSAIARDDWDAVVLQDASWMSFSFSTRRVMRDAVRELSQAAARSGSKVVFYAHWAPGKWRRLGLSAPATWWIERTYSGLAEEFGGRVAMAGRLWRSAEVAGIDGLYAPDGHHQSEKGAYAAALSILKALGDTPAETATWLPAGVSPQEQAVLLNELRKMP